jgi:hypothetical protein
VAKVYIENGGDVKEILDDTVKEKLSKVVDKSVLASEIKLELERSEHD